MSDEGRSPGWTLQPAKKLDRFELLALVAQGGMANVWVARLSGKHGVAKRFAVKTILPHLAVDAEFCTMFVNEARVASRVEHPNVAQIYELGEHEGVLYMVMEWVDGDSIEALIEAAAAADPASKGRIPTGISVGIIADACAGIHAAHELTTWNERERKEELLGVVHRDVSPQNLLITRFGITKVIDFGVAKARDRLGAQTSAGSTHGKICYMPREQALGETIDRRADVWAMGAVLHFMLAGEHPFAGETALDTLRRVMAGDAPRPLPASVPAPIAAIVARALAHDTNARYDTAAAMRAELLAAAEKLGIDVRHEDVAAFAEPRLAQKRTARDAMISRAIERVDLQASPSAETLSPVAAPAISFVRRDADAAPAEPESPRPATRRARREKVAMMGAAAAVVLATAALARRPAHPWAPSEGAHPLTADSHEVPARETTAATIGVEPSAYRELGPAANASDPPTAAATVAAAPPRSPRPQAPHSKRPLAARSAAGEAAPSSTPAPTASSPPRRDYGF